MRTIQVGYKNVHIASAEEIAVAVADIYEALLKVKPACVLGFATGSTPLPLYAELVRRYAAGRMSFRSVTSFNLDEYVGLAPTHDQSYRCFMDTNLFNHIDIDPAVVHVPSGLDTAAETLAAYDAAIQAAGGVDLQLLGIGCNGHIGFNEPGTPLDSLTHVVTLTQNTREVNARFFAGLDEVPTHAATMGIKTVMNARQLVLIATGASKAEALRATVCGPVTPEVPASVLQLHPTAFIFADEAAASLL